MASIMTAFQLTDRMTAPLMNITNAVSTVITEFERVQAVSGNAFNSSSIAKAKAQLGLADSELKKIASDTRQAIGEQEKYNSKVREGKGAAGGLLSTVKGLVASLGGIYIVRQGTQLLSDCAEKVSQLHQAETKLTEVMGAMQGAGTSQVNMMKNLASEISGYGVVGKTALINGAQQASTYFHQTDAVKTLLPKMADLAVQMHGVNVTSEDMVNIGNMTGKVMTGQVGALRRAGISFTDYQEKVMKNGTEMEKANMLAQVIEQNVGKMNEAMAKTPEGVMARNRKDFEGVKTVIGQQVQPAIVHMFNAIHNNLPTIQLIATGFANASVLVMGAITNIINIATRMVNIIKANWPLIEPIVWGIVTALIVYNATMGIGWLTTLKDIGTKGLHAIASAGQTAALIATTIAQQGLNAALAMCPLTWIIIAIIAVIAAIYLIVAAINKVQNKTISATGVIFGSISAFGAALINTVIGWINAILQYCWTFVTPFISIVEWVLNVANGGFDSFGGAVANLIGQIISWFLSLGKVVTKIIDAIFGTDWTSGLTALQDNVVAWGKNDNAITLNKEAPSIDYRIKYSDAYGKGYNIGKGVEDKVKDKVGGLFKKGEMDDPSKYGYGNEDAIANNTADTAANTAKSADSLDITSQQLKYIKDYAEQKAINRFTTAEIKVDMRNTINGTSDTDMEGIVSHLRTRLEEEMAATAEGVHG
ncbi:hypothetical protein [uncultured Eubacterium sp.]|uniref:hypothetical protein n=1 Tax=uncultured Eubacterium sp. TaxID=165185 RepID=UPI003266C901